MADSWTGARRSTDKLVISYGVRSKDVFKKRWGHAEGTHVNLKELPRAKSGTIGATKIMIVTDYNL